jgi:hypothetical protein
LSWQGLACKGGAKLVFSAAMAATETSDVRGWAALPAQIRMARIKLPPGKHDVMIQFKNSSGAVVKTRWFKDVQIDLKKRTYLAARTAI